ncbi:hypothetical protein MASR1M74_23470 [Lentimicrobium sp.]
MKEKTDMIRGNLFDIEDINPQDTEYFQTLLTGDGFKVERIVSHGQITPEKQWYNQPQDEWVALLQGSATLTFDDGIEVNLQKGEYIYIAAHQKHRVTFTSSTPPCIWLAIHSKKIHLQ